MTPSSRRRRARDTRRPAGRRRREGHGRRAPGKGSRCAAVVADPGIEAVAWNDLLHVIVGRAEGSVEDLRREFELEASRHEGLRGQLALLESAGLLLALRGGRWRLRGRVRAMVGRMSVPARGFGFAVSQDGDDPDVHIAANRMNGARHGATVLARWTPGARGSPGPTGEVIAILDPGSPRFPGVVRRHSREGMTITPIDRARGRRLPLGGWEAPAPGTVVVVETGEGRDGAEYARVSEVVGPENRPEVQESVVTRMFGLPGPFPDEVEEEARRHREAIPAQERARRTDFTSQPCLTIDPEDARDHDDAVHAERIAGPGAGFRLFVHIADVSWYVPAGTACDREAARRGVTVYLPGRCIPMLPPALSSDRCSLLPDRERLTLSAVLEFDARANLRKAAFVDGVIRSRARLTYDEAEDRIRAGRSDAISETLSLLGEFAVHAREARRRRGGLLLDLPETRVDLDPRGYPVALRTVRAGPAHAIIEESMLAANGAAAARLSRESPVAIYRVHEEPALEAVRAVEEAIVQGGRTVRGGDPGAHLRALLESVRGRPEEVAVAMRVLRALPMARYSEREAPHFGLAVPLYTHFTSPIRRYPDLIVHRLIRGSEPPMRSASGMARLARACSRLERRAEEAERMLVRVKTAAWMEKRVGEAVHGRVMGSTGGSGGGTVAAGLFVRLETGVDAVVPARDGPGRGRRPARRMARGPRIGEEVRVRVSRVDIARGIVEVRLLSTG